MNLLLIYNLDGQAGFKSTQELRQRYTDVLGGTRPDNMILYCGPGGDNLAHPVGHGLLRPADTEGVSRIVERVGEQWPAGGYGGGVPLGLKYLL